ncbi:RidA family protein [Weeksellaceae bacterium TAE3-ERU29]|nr:RidA family protein [Weeksellaceae bacterium TAE3-ERU29]
MKRVNTEKAPAAIGPYSQAVEHNGVLYVSGQIPINPENGELLNGIEEETHQVMKNLKAILENKNLGFDEVIKTTIFLKDMADFAVVNEIYGSYFTEGNYPARETVQVAKLPKDVSVEISLIAALK